MLGNRTTKNTTIRDDYTRVLGVGSFSLEGRGKRRIARIGEWRIRTIAGTWTISRGNETPRFTRPELIHGIIYGRTTADLA